MSATASLAPAFSSDASASRDGTTPDVGEIQDLEPPTLQDDETCGQTSVVPSQYPSYCRKTRSCRSCLQKTGCMIDPYGACVNQAGAQVSWTDYSVAFTLGLVLPNASTTSPESASSFQYWSFRSFEATYCAKSDLVCLECIQRNFWSQTARPDSRFCVGTNGCVCIWDCEARWYTPEVQCIASTSSPVSSIEHDPVSKSFDSVVKFMVLGLCAILLLFAACLFRCIRKDYDARRRREQRLQAVREARNALREHQRRQRLGMLGVSALNLSGWQSFRQSLIEKEKLRLHERTTGKPSTLADQEVSPTSATDYVLSVDDDDETDVPITNNVRPASEPPRASSTATVSATMNQNSVQ